MHEVRTSETAVEMTQLVLPGITNNHGKMDNYFKNLHAMSFHSGLQTKMSSLDALMEARDQAKETLEEQERRSELEEPTEPAGVGSTQAADEGSMASGRSVALRAKALDAAVLKTEFADKLSVTEDKVSVTVTGVSPDVTLVNMNTSSFTLRSTRRHVDTDSLHWGVVTSRYVGTRPCRGLRWRFCGDDHEYEIDLAPRGRELGPLDVLVRRGRARRGAEAAGAQGAEASRGEAVGVRGA